MQFAYLYSYHPSGPIKEIAADLELKWRTEHFKTSEDAFARVAAEGQSVAGPSFFKKAEIVSPVLSKSRDKEPASVLAAMIE